jgi:hypothetical protein
VDWQVPQLRPACHRGRLTLIAGAAEHSSGGRVAIDRCAGTSHWRGQGNIQCQRTASNSPRQKAGNPRRPTLIGGYDSLIPLAPTLRDIRELGVNILVTPAATGLLIAVDGAGLLISEGDIEVTTARHATVSLAGSPSVPNLNLWQSNLIALRAEQFVRFAVRDGATAYASTGSV